MGMKYIPTVRDQKAAIRFLNKQKPAPNFKKSSDKAAAAKSAPSSAPSSQPGSTP